MSKRRPGSRHHAALDRRRWQWTRLKAFERDGWRCTACGRAGRLEAHHEPPMDDPAYGGDPYDLAGIMTLCRSCHIERHRGDRETPGRAEWRAFARELVLREK